jgi:hypothetical protein
MNIKFPTLTHENYNIQEHLNQKIEFMLANALLLKYAEQLNCEQKADIFSDIIHSQQDWLCIHAHISHEKSTKIISDFVEENYNRKFGVDV